jgi:hypothetical protein
MRSGDRFEAVDARPAAPQDQARAPEIAQPVERQNQALQKTRGIESRGSMRDVMLDNHPGKCSSENANRRLAKAVRGQQPCPGERGEKAAVPGWGGNVITVVGIEIRRPAKSRRGLRRRWSCRRRANRPRRTRQTGRTRASPGVALVFHDERRFAIDQQAGVGVVTLIQTENDAARRGQGRPGPGPGRGQPASFRPGAAH